MAIDSRRIIVIAFVILATCAVLYRLNWYLHWHPTNQNWHTPLQRFQLNFIPGNYQGCEQIVPNITMSKFYEQTKLEFLNAADNATAGEVPQRTTAEIVGQYKTMHYLAGQGHVKTVCETGFNLGHSSFNYLTANDRLIVHSFDLGNHKYAYPMSEYMKKKFPGRFFIHFGDSTKTIPEFIVKNPNFTCDYMFVDGGHLYPVSLADILNFAKIANLKENIILFDDYPTDWGIDYGKAWEEMIKAGVIEEKMRCIFIKKPGTQHGFTIGRILKRPAHGYIPKQP